MPYSARILFNAILEKLLRSQSQKPIQYEISETDNEITIVADEKDALTIQKTLEQTLSSSENFQQSLPYTLQTVSTSKPSTSVQSKPVATPLLGDVNPSTIKDILHNLFGSNAFTEMALNLDNLLTDAKIENGVVYFKSATQKKIAAAWNASLEYLLLYFASSSLGDIRRAWEGNGPLERPNDQIDAADSNQGISKGLLQECFGTITQKNPTQIRIFFNFQKFYQFLYPPKISTAAITQAGTAKAKITVNKMHFHDHVRMLAKQGILFRVYKKDEKILANPLLLAKDPLQKEDTHIAVMIDCSGSMSEYDKKHNKPKMQQAKDNIFALVEKIKAYDENAIIRFVPFSSNILSIDTYAVKDTAKITEYLSQMEPVGMTDLFGTINHELDNYAKQPELQQGNTLYFLYTDGQDTVTKDVRLVDNKVSEITARVPLPKFISFGIGQDHDADTLNKLAQLTGNPYFHVDSVADLGPLLNLHLGDSLKERALKQFIYQMGGETFEATLPLTKGDVVSTDLRVEIPHLGEVAITYDGQQLLLSVPDSNTVPAANPYDQLLDFAKDARRTVQNEKLSKGEVQAQLNVLVSRVTQLTFISNQEQADQQKVIAEIAEYSNAISKGHDYTIKSMRALAAKRSGIIAVQAHTPQAYTCSGTDGSCQANSPAPQAVSQQNGGQNPSPTMRKILSIDTDESPSIPFIPVKPQTSDSQSIHSHWILLPLFRLLAKQVDTMYQTGQLFIQTNGAVHPPIHITALTVTQASASYVGGSCTLTGTPTPFPYDNNYVFQFNCTADGRWLGKLSLYGSIIPCSLDSGNNILRIDGAAGFITSILKTAQAEVCSSLPPSTWQLCKQETVSSSLSGAGMGTLRGIETVAAQSMMRRYGIGAFAAKTISKVGSYGIFFTASFYCNVDTNKPETTDAERYAKYAEAAYKAGISTVILAATEIGAFAVQQSCRLSSDRVRAAGYPRTATWVQRFGTVVTKAPLAIQTLRAPVTAFFHPEAGVSIATAAAASIPATAAAVVSGTVCEKAVTAIGKRLFTP